MKAISIAVLIFAVLANVTFCEEYPDKDNKAVVLEAVFTLKDKILTVPYGATLTIKDNTELTLDNSRIVCYGKPVLGKRVIVKATNCREALFMFHNSSIEIEDWVFQGAEWQENNSDVDKNPTTIERYVYNRSEAIPYPDCLVFADSIVASGIKVTNINAIKGMLFCAQHSVTIDHSTIESCVLLILQWSEYLKLNHCTIRDSELSSIAFMAVGCFVDNINASNLSFSNMIYNPLSALEVLRISDSTMDMNIKGNISAVCSLGLTYIKGCKLIIRTQKRDAWLSVGEAGIIKRNIIEYYGDGMCSLICGLKDLAHDDVIIDDNKLVGVTIKRESREE